MDEKRPESESTRPKAEKRETESAARIRKQASGSRKARNRKRPGTVQYCAVLYSTVQYCTVLYNTVQYCTVPRRFQLGIFLLPDACFGIRAALSVSRFSAFGRVLSDSGFFCLRGLYDFQPSFGGPGSYGSSRLVSNLVSAYSPGLPA